MNKVLCVGKRIGNSPMTIKYAGSENEKQSQQLAGDVNVSRTSK